MDNNCEEPHYHLNPEAIMTILSPTGKMRFVVRAPPTLKMNNPVGFIREHPGVHLPIIKEPLQVDNNTITWEPGVLETNLSYQIAWTWSHPTMLEL